MNAKNAYTECVRRTGQRGVSMGTFPGWHVLGTGIGRNDTTALVKSDADARLYAAAPALLAALLEVKRLRDLWRSQEDDSIDSVAYMDGLDRIDVDAVIAGAKGS